MTATAQFTRTAQAVTRRVDRFLARRLSKTRDTAPQIIQCCCLRFERKELTSARQWCAECESEFLCVMAKLVVLEVAA